MNLETLRNLIGADKFDAAIAAARKSRAIEERKPKSVVEEMESEPGNDGLTLEEGRAALRRAAERKVDLPPPSVLFNR